MTLRNIEFVKRHFRRMLERVVAAVLLSCGLVAPVFAAPITFEATGANAAAIQPTVDAFRTALGTNNGGAATPFPSGRREINWDGVPDALAAPNNLPSNQFQGRGVLFDTPGTGFQVSANSGVAPIEFDNLFAGNSTLFAPFSPQRLFVALGSTITDVTFVVPGSLAEATTSGFGVVFSDVDVANLTSLSFFDLNDNLLFSRSALSFAGNESFSFLGVIFDAGERIARVRITAGDQPVSSATCDDCVAMDDFIYAEPQPASAPEPVTAVLVGGGLAGMLLRRRRGAK